MSTWLKEDDPFWAAREAKEKQQDELIAKAEELLRSLGVELKVSGCGCCGSPNLSLRYKGIVYLDDLDSVSLDSWKAE